MKRYLLHLVNHYTQNLPILKPGVDKLRPADRMHSATAFHATHRAATST